jgi:hypothetical protein
LVAKKSEAWVKWLYMLSLELAALLLFVLHPSFAGLATRPDTFFSPHRRLSAKGNHHHEADNRQEISVCISEFSWQ